MANPFEVLMRKIENPIDPLLNRFIDQAEDAPPFKMICNYTAFGVIMIGSVIAVFVGWAVMIGVPILLIILLCKLGYFLLGAWIWLMVPTIICGMIIVACLGENYDDTE